MNIEKVFREAGVVPNGSLMGLIYAALEDQRKKCAQAAKHAVINDDLFTAVMVETACLKAK